MVLYARLLLLCGMCVLVSAGATAQQYTVTDLGTSEPIAINDHGHVVGFSPTTGHALMWVDGTTHDLGTLPNATFCLAMAINNNDQVAGSCNSNQAFLWTSDTGMVALPIPVFAEALGINEHGHIVGVYACTDTGRCPFLFQNGAFERLGTCMECTGMSVNDSDQVVGWSPLRPMLWDQDGEHDLGTLDPDGFGAANAINAAGLAVGRSTTGGGTDAVLWNPYGIANLGRLGGGGAEARAISGDLIVGLSSTASGDVHAFLYDNNGPGYPIDLNDWIPADSGWVLVNAAGVNATGQIVGSGTADHVSHGFLLTPVGASSGTDPRE